MLGDRTQCARLLGRAEREVDIPALRVMEVGAGCGIPSWVMCQQGATVVCTDYPDNDLLFQMARSAHVCMEGAGAGEAYVRGLWWGENGDHCLNAGMPVDAPLDAGKFDVVLAADCIYTVAAHQGLLDTLTECLVPDTGVALCAFGFHGLAKQEVIVTFFDRAKDNGFTVEFLETKQVTNTHTRESVETM
jgi:predicted nicotinamide N-methyase